MISNSVNLDLSSAANSECVRDSDEKLTGFTKGSVSMGKLCRAFPRPTEFNTSDHGAPTSPLMLYDESATNYGRQLIARGNAGKLSIPSFFIGDEDESVDAKQNDKSVELFQVLQSSLQTESIQGIPS
jgi:hypothetical protein